MIPAGTVADWNNRYEQLRRLILGGAGSMGRGWGAALVMRQGLVAWMRAWPQRIETPPVRQPHAGASVPAVSTDAGALVTALAGMIFSARQEVEA